MSRSVSFARGPPDPAMVEILVEPRTGDPYRVMLPQDVVTVGRARSCDVVLSEDLSLSRQHAEICRSDRGIVVRDLGSRNGTFVNGNPTATEGTLLAPGDEISLGETRLKVKLSEEIAFRPDTEVASEGTMMLNIEDLLAPSTLPAKESAEEDSSSRLRRFATQLTLIETAGHSEKADRSLPELLASLLDRIFAMFPVDRGVIALDRNGKLVPVATRHRDPDAGEDPISLSRSVTDLALKERKAVSTLDAQLDPRFSEQASIRLSGIRSAVCAPLYAGRDVLGILYVDSLATERPLDMDDLTLLSTLAVVAAMKIENHQLIEAYLAKQRIDRELEIAEEISQSILPEHPPEVPGLGIFARNVSCHAIGGDYFDFKVEPPWLHFVVADVCGKGIPAAMVMASLQATFRANIGHIDDPADLVATLNRLLFESTPSNKYATLFYGRLSLETSEFHYVNAGHNPPVLINRDGDVTPLPPGGTVCGLFDEAVYDTRGVPFEDGDLLAVFTDGLPDEATPDGLRIGDAKIQDWFRELRAAGLNEIGRTIFDRLDEWNKGGKRFDDRTLVLIRRGDPSR